jgi:predicted nucleotidyltransferase/uncharacterized protein (UPF0332 family)
MSNNPNKNNNPEKEKEQEKTIDSEISSSQDEKKYSNEKISMPEQKPANDKENKKAMAEMEKTKKKLEELKKEIVKKYPYISAIGIIPAAANEKLIEEEIEQELPEKELEEMKKMIHLCVIIPDEKEKQLAKIKLELIQKIKNFQPKVWLHFYIPKDIWEIGFDGKYEVMEAISMAYPLHDKGLLGSLRVAQIHKSLVLKKFERYVVSYIVAGSMVRGNTVKTSDVDVFIIVNDTDVKRMSRLELKEKLRGIIYSYAMEAGELAGVKNKLSPQIYILTEFWESVKDAHPVIFTFIRDGVPLYDLGTFMPWKQLLRMGKLKPSPESIEMFMSMGDKVEEITKKRLIDIVVNDIYWSVITPSQALLMLFGVAPPTPKETVTEMRKIFYEREKMLEKRYINILEEIVGLYKKYEHDTLKEVKGEKIDKLVKDCMDYMKRLKELQKQIEKNTNSKIIIDLNNEVFELLHTIFKDKSEKKLKDNIKGKIKQGIFPSKTTRILETLVKSKTDIKKNKLTKHEVESIRKNTSYLINFLTEYIQRKEIACAEKQKIKVKLKGKDCELILTKEIVFLVREKDILKFTKNSLVKSSAEEMTNALTKQDSVKEIKIKDDIFKILEKEFGDYEIIL